jgi:hypothetical protein
MSRRHFERQTLERLIEQSCRVLWQVFRFGRMSPAVHQAGLFCKLPEVSFYLENQWKI